MSKTNLFLFFSKMMCFGKILHQIIELINTYIKLNTNIKFTTYRLQITTNLCTFLCSDVEFTPRLTETEVDPFDGILTLNNRQRYAERVAYNRGTGFGIGGGRGPGRPPNTEIPLEELLAYEEPEAKASRTRRRGATLALTSIGRLTKISSPQINSP